MKPGVVDHRLRHWAPWSDAERIARETRREMRGWALWWRRGSQGSTPDLVLSRAKALGSVARNMEAQAKRLKALSRSKYEKGGASC